ncbi:c-type cytochrome [Paraglaciecola aquimarina]|uniref:C-type cytochrome n=1 Tax=Paraglaciecola aquimarina TaxID=1235557 RepID=A0ABU3STN6_9ALTE|nr:c-type cytochrome [Paraglaciecola aquimarina]MDU0353365.1 c-type cytochrome [Paraglaciecola aquimarina]
MKNTSLLICLLLSFSASSIAQGDAEKGKAKSIACGACHGADGNSAISLNPKLAGQHAKYLVKQLNDFKLASQTGGSEGRNNAVMNGMAAALSEQDIQDIAAYFSSQTGTQGETPENFVELGSKLYKGGDLERGITACIACHGPRGNGTSLSGFPDISGQHTDYVKAQLKAFRSGDRTNSANGMMEDIAKKMSDNDIEVLANYVAGLH